MIQSGKIKEITISDMTGVATITGKTIDNKKFETNFWTSALIDTVQPMISEGKLNVNFNTKTASTTWISIIPVFLIVILLIVFFFMLTQQTQGGGNRVMSFGKSKAKLHPDDKKQITFARCCRCR